MKPKLRATPLVFATLAIALAAVTAAAGCGYSEEEMQAVRKDLDQCKAQRGSSGSSGPAKCLKDTDCQGDSVCNAGACSAAH